MSGERLLIAMGSIEDRFVDEAASPGGSRRRIWIRWCAAAACVVLVLSLSLVFVGQTFRMGSSASDSSNMTQESATAGETEEGQSQNPENWEMADEEKSGWITWNGLRYEPVETPWEGAPEAGEWIQERVTVIEMSDGDTVEWYTVDEQFARALYAGCSQQYGWSYWQLCGLAEEELRDNGEIEMQTLLTWYGAASAEDVVSVSWSGSQGETAEIFAEREPEKMEAFWMEWTALDGGKTPNEEENTHESGVLTVHIQLKNGLTIQAVCDLENGIWSQTGVRFALSASLGEWMENGQNREG